MSNYIYTPFGSSGIRATVPIPVQSNGSVSYTSGFTVNYTYPITTNPAAIAVPLDQFNQLIFDTQSAIQKIQQQGIPDFITTADNQGTPYPYAQNAVVRYNGDNYISLINGNTDLPTVISSWSPFTPSSNNPQISQDVWAADIGSVNALVANPSNPYASYVDGTYIRVVVGHTNTGAATLNVSSLGSANILLATGAPLSGGELRASRVHEFFYSTLASGWILLNPWVTSSNPQISQNVWAADTGATNALVANPSTPYAALVDGAYIRVIVANINTGPATLNVSSLGSAPILLKTGVALNGGELQSNRVHEFFYSSILGGWIVLNPWVSIITGSNSNGNYRIYQDGSMDQWGPGVFPANSGGTTSSVTITFPVPFTTQVQNLQITIGTIGRYTAANTATLTNFNATAAVPSGFFGGSENFYWEAKGV